MWPIKEEVIIRCWLNVVDNKPTLRKHRLNTSQLLGIKCPIHTHSRPNRWTSFPLVITQMGIWLTYWPISAAHGNSFSKENSPHFDHAERVPQRAYEVLSHWWHNVIVMGWAGLTSVWGMLYNGYIVCYLSCRLPISSHGYSVIQLSEMAIRSACWPSLVSRAVSLWW